VIFFRKHRYQDWSMTYF